MWGHERADRARRPGRLSRLAPRGSDLHLLVGATLASHTFLWAIAALADHRPDRGVALVSLCALGPALLIFVRRAARAHGSVVRPLVVGEAGSLAGAILYTREVHPLIALEGGTLLLAALLIAGTLRHEARRGPRFRAGQRGSALVEIALLLPLLLFLAFGVIGAARVTQARLGVSAVAREAARAAAQAQGPGQASANGYGRAREVADGYGLDNGSLRVMVDAGGFGPGDMIRTSATYEVTFRDLPLLGWGRVEVGSIARERIDLYRSRWR